MSIKLNIFYSLMIAFCVSCGLRDNTDTDEDIENTQLLTETIVYNTTADVDDNLLSLDIYYDDNTTDLKPIVVWVHGGGWAIGDKTNSINDKVNLFQSNDWLFVSINYRLSPFPYEIDNEDRIKYPDHNHDVADAIQWIYENIEVYGGDANNIVLLGHSAGAHLVSLTGTDNGFLEDRGVPFSIIKGVASIDTEGYNVEQIVSTGSNIYINAFGTVPSQNINASPIYNINSDTEYPNFFIAKRGSASRIASSDAFIIALEAQGVVVSQVEGSIYTHEEINDAIGQEGETLITDPLIAFMNECFGL